MSFDVRVRNHGSLWEMRPGTFGSYQFFESREVALRQAHLAAREAWEHRRIPAHVRLLQPDGIWVIDASFGSDATAH
jgi:hypothetical protein